MCEIVIGQHEGVVQVTRRPSQPPSSLELYGAEQGRQDAPCSVPPRQQHLRCDAVVFRSSSRELLCERLQEFSQERTQIRIHHERPHTPSPPGNEEQGGDAETEQEGSPSQVYLRPEEIELLHGEPRGGGIPKLHRNVLQCSIEQDRTIRRPFHAGGDGGSGAQTNPCRTPESRVLFVGRKRGTTERSSDVSCGGREP